MKRICQSMFRLSAENCLQVRFENMGKIFFTQSIAVGTQNVPLICLKNSLCLEICGRRVLSDLLQYSRSRSPRADITQINQIIEIVTAHHINSQTLRTPSNLFPSLFSPLLTCPSHARLNRLLGHALQVLQVAEMVNAPLLRESALFYAEHNLSQVSQQEGFQETVSVIPGVAEV